MALIEEYEVGKLKIQIHRENSDTSQHPIVPITVPFGYRVIGGGAMVNWYGHGSLLTSIYPRSERVWIAEAKDHKVPSPSTITAYCIAAKMKDGTQIPNDDYIILQETSSPSNHPQAEVVLPEGFIMVGGGARTNWSRYGSLLTASYPTGKRGWFASAKDHFYPELTTVTAFVIGVKKSFLKRSGLEVIVKESSSGSKTSYPSVSCALEHGFRLIGGGAKTNWKNYGSLLTSSYPQDRHIWRASGKDHIEPELSNITAWAIGFGVLGGKASRDFRSNLFGNINYSELTNLPFEDSTLMEKTQIKKNAEMQ